MEGEYKHENTCLYLVNYHLIFCPRRRRKILGGSIKQRLLEIFAEVAEELAFEIIAVEVMPDHVHIFVSSDPQTCPNNIAARLKGKSSRLLRLEFPYLAKMQSLWTRSYLCSTAGFVSSATIQRYIEMQTKR